jgi:hypothetical protein
MVSAAVACLPTTVSLLLLETLFMQISGVSLALTWPCRLCLLRFLLCVSLCYKLSPFQAHWGKWHCTRVVRPVCLFTVHAGGGSSPLSCVVFLPLPLSQAFLLLLTGRCCCSCQLPYLFTVHVGSGSSLLSCRVFLSPPFSQASLLLVAGRAPRSHQRLSGPPSLFIYSLRKGSLHPIFSAQGAPTSFQHVFIALIAYYSVSLFFPGWGSVCPGGYAALAQACLWGNRGTAKLTWFVSSQAFWAPATGGPGTFLVSPFNVKWRFSALAGGVEGSKLCLFSVIMPAKCVSSISPRFHYRRVAFCFLPLAAILESPLIFFEIGSQGMFAIMGMNQDPPHLCLLSS